MKLNWFKNTTKQIICVALVCSMILSLVILNADTSYANVVINENQQSYKWVKVESQEELEAAISQANGGVPVKKMDKNYDSDTYWTRVMLIWQSGDDYYFTSGGAGSDSDYWYGKKVLSGYGIDPTADTFITRTGLDTPYIKECTGGQDPDYDQDNAYCFRLCESGSERMTEYCASCELNFWGKAYRAATKSRFTLYSKVTDPDCTPWKSKLSCNDDRLVTTNLRFFPTWESYFCNNDYNITEKQKNALLVAFSHYAWYEQGSTKASADGHYEIDDLYDVLSEDCIKIGKTPSGYWRQDKYSDAEQVRYALEKCTDESLYDTSIFTKTYITKEYPQGISGVEAYTKLFKSLCSAYNDRDRDNQLGHAYCYYDFHGYICQRFWRNYGNQLDIDDTSLSKATNFIVYIGIPYNTPQYNLNVALPSGINFISDSTQINNDVTVTVGVGSTLYVEGHVYNNGTINVDGGNLVITGVLDTDPSLKVATGVGQATNNVIIQNGGTCIINETGAFIGRDDNSSFTVTGNSSLQVDGVLITAKMIVQNNSTVRSDRVSAICVGSKAKQILSVSKYNVELLEQEKNHSIGSLVDSCSDSVSYLRLSGASSFICDGLVYVHGAFLVDDGEAADSCAYSMWMETDPKRTIKDGIKYWQ